MYVPCLGVFDMTFSLDLIRAGWGGLTTRNNAGRTDVLSEGGPTNPHFLPHKNCHLKFDLDAYNSKSRLVKPLLKKYSSLV